MSEAEPTLVIFGEKKKRGRPRLKEPRSAVSTRVPVSVHDKLIELASERDTSVSELVRKAIVIAITPRNLRTE